MAVFEATRYPFRTERSDTLLEGLRGMFESRDGLSDDERQRALRWLDTGALDNEGKPPVFLAHTE